MRARITHVNTQAILLYLKKRESQSLFALSGVSSTCTFICASKIVNYSREPQRRVDLTFGADYTCRPEQVKAALHNAVSLVSGIL